MNMAKTEVKTEVVKTKDATLEKKTKAAELLKKNIEDMQSLMDKKVYLVEGGAETGNALLTFIQTKAEWKFSESMGIIESERQIKEALDQISKGKTKELMLKNLTLEAIYYFMTKVTGMGIAEAKVYYTNMLKPVSEGLSRVKADKDKLDQLVRDLGTIEHAIDQGVSIEDEDTFVKEIMGELDGQLA